MFDPNKAIHEAGCEIAGSLGRLDVRVAHCAHAQEMLPGRMLAVRYADFEGGRAAGKPTQYLLLH